MFENVFECVPTTIDESCEFWDEEVFENYDDEDYDMECDISYDD